MLVTVGHPDVGADISREMEYQMRRGHEPRIIEVSPEAHEAMRLIMKAPTGAILREHDGVRVRIYKKLIGVKAWRIIYTRTSPVTERQKDQARLAAA